MDNEQEIKLYIVLSTNIKACGFLQAMQFFDKIIAEK